MRRRVLFIVKSMKIRQFAHETVSKIVLAGVKLFAFFASPNLKGFIFILKKVSVDGFLSLTLI